MIEGGTLTASAIWIEQVLTGTVASIIAVLAVAAIGLLMIAGRMPWRRGVEVVIGIFVIFGSSTIAEGLLDSRPVQMPEVAPVAPVSPVTVAPPRPAVYDPYAGASVPQNRAPSDLLTPRP